MYVLEIFYYNCQVILNVWMKGDENTPIFLNEMERFQNDNSQ